MKKAILVTAGVVVGVGALGYGGWYAWDTGLIPGNKRAPTVEVMEPVVRRHVMALRQMRQPLCVGPEVGRVPAEVQGRPGIAPRAVPGQHAVTYLLEGSAQSQDARERLLTQFNYLAKQGLFTESEASVETDVGTRAGREYRLTWNGFAALAQEGNLCFAAGTHRYAGIESISRLHEGPLGVEVWEASFRMEVDNVPAWASAAEFKKLFPRAAEGTVGKTEKARLFRGKEGWLTEQEMQVEMQMSQLRASGQDVSRYAAYLAAAAGAKDNEPPALDAASAAKLFNDYLGSEQWQSRSMAVCLPLPLQRGGDDRGSTAFDRTSFTATWRDAPARRDYERNTMVTQLHVLSALQAVGLATAEEAEPGMVNNEAVNRGLKFTLRSEAIDTLGLAGGGCMPIGRVGKIELLGFLPSATGGRIAARGEMALVQPWARSLAERLPSLKQLLDEGIPYVGQVQYSPKVDPSGTLAPAAWQVSSLSPMYPQMQFQTVPRNLWAYYPATANAAVKLVKAPMTLPGLPPGALPPVAAAQPAPAVQAVAPSTGAAPAAPQPASRAPYPADSAEVHVISVYEGQLPPGVQHGFQNHPEGRIDVVIRKTAAPVYLVVASYEPVEWRVKVEGGNLQRVIAVGYHDQRVTISGASGVPIMAGKGYEAFRSARISAGEGLPYEARGNKALQAAEVIHALSGKIPASYQGEYKATKVFVVDASSPKLELPQPKSVASQGAGSVTLTTGHFKNAIGNNTVQYGGAGAYTEAWATRAYSQGKVYFEATLGVEGGGQAKPHANVGITELDARGQMETSSFAAQTAAIAHGEQNVYNHGDVFGIAVDYDAGAMYVRVNGKWLTGEPGSGQGKRFRTGRERAAYLFATGGGQGGGDRKGSVSWQANFGASPFRDAVPAGYVSYDGTRR